MSRSDQAELGKLEGRFQWVNIGNWIVIGILVLEWLQVRREEKEKERKERRIVKNISKSYLLYL